MVSAIKGKSDKLNERWVAKKLRHVHDLLHAWSTKNSTNSVKWSVSGLQELPS